MPRTCKSSWENVKSQYRLNFPEAMAQISPSLLKHRADAGLARELAVLEDLQQCLPDGFEIFHSVGWHSLLDGADRHGEIDLVVLAPCGNILLIEVKAGDVILRSGEILKLYRGEEHDVGRQTRVQYSAMVSRLSGANLHAHVTNCLLIPDYRVGESRVVAIPRERIIDASDYADLGSRVREMLSVGNSRSDHDAIRAFLANEFRVSTDLNVMGDQIRRGSQRLADGLATWVPRIVSPSGAFQIQATAGSGKTQLALRLLEDAITKGQRSLYVCFNRSLADHIARIASPKARVTSFHELGVDHYRCQHGEPDFTRTGIFDAIAQLYCEAADSLPARYDLIIVDEAQDFEPDWISSLLSQLDAKGRLYLLEDADQQLYARDAVELDGAVRLECHDNFRSPHAICDTINALGLSSKPIAARGPYAGSLPGFRTYSDEASLRAQTLAAVRDLQARGISLEGIVILSGMGRSRSLLQNTDHLGEIPLHHFTGQYNADGNPVWKEGELLVESVYRFKGQSASAVVFSELDFEVLDDAMRHKLFVGLTRAHLAVEMVLSPRAEKCLGEALADPGRVC